MSYAYENFDNDPWDYEAETRAEESFRDEYEQVCTRWGVTSRQRKAFESVPVDYVIPPIPPVPSLSAEAVA